MDVRLGGVAGLFYGLFGAAPKGGIVVMVRACIDESEGYRNPGAPFLLYGHVARVARWDRFDKAWRKELRKERVGYFHAKEILGSDGDYAGWQLDRKVSFCGRLEAVVDKEVEFAFCTVLRVRDFAEWKQESGSLAGQLDSQYGVSFRGALTFLQWVVPLLIPAKRHDVYIVVEDGHPNVGCVYELHSRMKKYIDGCIVRSVIPVDKKECFGTQAADLRALPLLRHELEGATYEPIGSADEARSDERIRQFAKGNAMPVFRLPLGPEMLSDLRDRVIQSRPKFMRRFSSYLSSSARLALQD